MKLEIIIDANEKIWIVGASTIQMNINNVSEAVN